MILSLFVFLGIISIQNIILMPFQNFAMLWDCNILLLYSHSKYCMCAKSSVTCTLAKSFTLFCYSLSSVCYLLIANMVTVSSCTITSNTKCKCKDGYYMKALSTSTLECRPCKNCGPGQMKIGNCKLKLFNLDQIMN